MAAHLLLLVQQVRGHVEQSVEPRRVPRLYGHRAIRSHIRSHPSQYSSANLRIVTETWDQRATRFARPGGYSYICKGRGQ
eukprot:5487572-Pyramimonas_sp.AAC.1